jgi:hypothetical protein
MEPMLSNRPSTASRPAEPAAAAPLDQAFLYGLIGAGIAVACLIPPIVHFISGPLGPLIGGAFAGARTKTAGMHAVVAGLTIGVLLGLVVPVLGVLLEAILPVRFPSEALVIVGIVAFFYSTALGTAGAWIGAWMSRPQERTLASEPVDAPRAESPR